MPSPTITANTPISVTVVFPRADNGILGDGHHVENVLGTGHPGTHVIHSAAVANFTGGLTPVNAVELATLAARIAADWYAWRLASMEVRLENAVDWSADGMHDLEFIHAGNITTAVMRSSWEPDNGNLKHAGTFGSEDVPVVVSGITSINGDPTPDQILDVGTAGTDFDIDDSVPGTHTFNLPDASTISRGVVNKTSQNFIGHKTFYGSRVTDVFSPFAGPLETAFEVITNIADSTEPPYIRWGHDYAWIGGTTGAAYWIVKSKDFLSGVATTEARVSLVPAHTADGIGLSFVLHSDLTVYPAYAIEDTSSAYHYGAWATVSGLVFKGGLYISGSLSGVVTSITGDAGAATGLTITVGGTGAAPTLQLGGTLQADNGGFGADVSAYTGLPIFTAGVASNLTDTRASGAVLEQKMAAGRWLKMTAPTSY